MKELLEPTARPFLEALKASMPNVDSRRIDWAFHFMLGAIAQLLAKVVALTASPMARA